MDLDRLNSATKYPSILTYHAMGDHGRLKQDIQVKFEPGTKIHVTEKVDGCNGRIVMLPNGPRKYLIGSREEFLFAQGDLVHQKDYGIVEALSAVADVVPPPVRDIVVLFFEVFGGDLPASKQYSKDKSLSSRLFDVAGVPIDILDQPRQKIAGWREHGGQIFAEDRHINETCELFQLKSVTVQRVPCLTEVTTLPTSIQDTYAWLKTFEKTCCDLGGGRGRAEGVVVRSADRKSIAKIRFEDYERTMRTGGGS